MKYVEDEVSDEGVILMKIANAWESANDPDDSDYNREVIKNEVMSDYRGYIHSHFPTLAGRVETEYNYEAAR
jgi:hypothetical protein